MAFRVRIRVRRGRPGQEGVEAECLDHPDVRAKGPTLDATLENLQGEIQYRADWCPCTGTHASDVIFDVVEGGVGSYRVPAARWGSI